MGPTSPLAHTIGARVNAPGLPAITPQVVGSSPTGPPSSSLKAAGRRPSRGLSERQRVTPSPGADHRGDHGRQLPHGAPRLLGRDPRHRLSQLGAGARNARLVGGVRSPAQRPAAPGSAARQRRPTGDGGPVGGAAVARMDAGAGGRRCLDRRLHDKGPRRPREPPLLRRLHDPHARHGRLRARWHLRAGAHGPRGLQRPVHGHPGHHLPDERVSRPWCSSAAWPAACRCSVPPDAR